VGFDSRFTQRPRSHFANGGNQDTLFQPLSKRFGVAKLVNCAKRKGTCVAGECNGIDFLVENLLMRSSMALLSLASIAVDGHLYHCGAALL
jgi:hypothetical protein